MSKSDSQAIKRDTFLLLAVVGPGSLNNSKYSFTLAGWGVQDHSLLMVFHKQIPTDFQDQEIYRSVQDLENILLSLFVNDRIPRKLFYFSFSSSLDKDTYLRLLFMLGQPPTNAKEANEEIQTESYSHSGLIFNRRPNWDWIPSNKSIEEWFNLFRNSEPLAGSVLLVQRAFWTVNGLYGKYRYYDYLDLCEAVVDLTAGLENLFVEGSCKVSAQFREVGARYYDRYVDQDYFRALGEGDQKLTFDQMKELLAHLYAIRSAVAHGQARKLFAKHRNKWPRMLKCMNAAAKEPTDKAPFFTHILLALGHMQKHIFAMLSRLRDCSIPGEAVHIPGELRVHHIELLTKKHFSG